MRKTLEIINLLPPKYSSKLVKDLEKEAFNLIYKIICNVHNVASDNIIHLIRDMENKGFNGPYGLNIRTSVLLFIYLLSPETLTEEELSEISILSTRLIVDFRRYLSLEDANTFARFSIYLNEINANLEQSYNNIFTLNNTPEAINAEFLSNAENILANIYPHNTYFNQEIRRISQETIQAHASSPLTEIRLNGLTSAIINHMEGRRNTSTIHYLEEALSILNPLSILRLSILNKIHEERISKKAFKQKILEFIITKYSNTSENNGLIILNEELTLSFQEATDILFYHLTDGMLDFRQRHSLRDELLKSYSSENLDRIIDYFEGPFSVLRENIERINELRAEEIQTPSSRPLLGSIDWLIEESGRYATAATTPEFTSSASNSPSSSHYNTSGIIFPDSYSSASSAINHTTSLQGIPTLPTILPIGNIAAVRTNDGFEETFHFDA